MCKSSWISLILVVILWLIILPPFYSIFTAIFKEPWGTLLYSITVTPATYFTTLWVLRQSKKRGKND